MQLMRGACGTSDVESSCILEASSNPSRMHAARTPSINRPPSRFLIGACRARTPADALLLSACISTVCTRSV
jgi:hypothetical protein